MTATLTEPRTVPTADRKAVEAMLRDAAFVLRMTQRIKQELFADVPTVVDRATAEPAVRR